MKTKSSFSVLIFFVILAVGLALAYVSYDVQNPSRNINCI